jgi:hypothetical protein
MVFYNSEIRALHEQYFGTIQMPIEDEDQYEYFQQDNTTAHTPQHFVEALCEIFSERIIG